MTKSTDTPRASFSSKFGIIAAAAGSAIGLGNIWRFPYILGEGGGGAFLLVYLLFVIFIGIPVMLSEFIIGRSTQMNPFGAFKKLAPKRPWFIIGIMGIIASFIILAFYGVVGGWTLEYLYKSVLNQFSGKSAEEVSQIFEGFRSNSYRPLLWQVIFMGFTFLIVVAGIEKGIEKYSKILMPILVLLLIVIAIRSVTLPAVSEKLNPGEGLKFLFNPDFSRLNAKAVFNALGQCFFSLSIGMGALITYGSYIKKNDNMGSSAMIISLSDTFVAVLAGIAIFPAVFALGFDPQQGESLVFKILPAIFQNMPGGYFVSILFFICLFVAALTSAISLLEVVVTTFVEELKMSRKKASIIASLLITVLGGICALSWYTFRDLAVNTLDKSTGQMVHFNFFMIFDYVACKFMLPIGGLLIVVYLGWFHGKKNIRMELSNQGALKVAYFNVLMFLIKFVAPVAITFIFLNETGILKFN
ncbi:MAG TPA: sodium-dependent transporter [Bacteroidales bacterium]|nr:sodium-dependent transporter [Bacteroidales bacterium]